jgi:hypothetical protein
MDLTDTIVPKSDQLNAEDLLSGPRTVTITEVHKGASVEQPVDVVLAEFGPGRPFKPSKTVRRILVLAWGADAAAYAGRRLTIYRDPAVRFGGIRVSHLSHLSKPLTVALTVSKGKRAAHTVQPLPDAPTPAQAKQPTAEELIADAERATTNDELNRIARAAAATLTKDELDAVREVVTARRADLQTGAES